MVAAFLSPLLHFQLFMNWHWDIGRDPFLFFVVLVPIPVCALFVLVALQFVERTWLRRTYKAFLGGALLYFPIPVFYFFFMARFGI